MKRFLFALCLPLILTLPAPSQWGAGGCFPTAGPVGPLTVPVYAQPPAGGYSWYRSKNSPGWWLLHGEPRYGGAGGWVGCYHPGKGFRWLLTRSPDTWSNYCTAPIALPEPLRLVAPEQALSPPAEKWVTSGVDTSKISTSAKASFSGTDIPFEQALDLVQQSSGQLSDDSAKPGIVVIGTKEQRDQVLAALDASPKLKELWAGFRQWWFAPDHYQVKGRKQGSPMIYFEVPKKDNSRESITLLELDRFEGAEKLLAATQDALHRLDPEKHPLPAPVSPDVGPRLPGVDLSQVPPNLIIVGLAGAILAGLVFFNRRNQS